MDQQIELYLNKLITSCLESDTMKSLSEQEKAAMQEKLTQHFNTLILSTLLDNLSDEQIQQIQQLDLSQPTTQDKLSLLAAETPGFIITLDERLQKEATIIQQTGKIPENAEE